MANYQYLIDWLRFTLPSHKDTVNEFVEHFGLDVEVCNPVGYYNSALWLKTPSGARVGKAEWHTEKPQQKVCFTFTGRDLDAWRETELGVMALFAYALASDCNFTRIDFACDVLDDENASVDALVAGIEEGSVRLKGKSYSVISSVSRGMVGTTLYIGARASDKYIRIYNKAVEQGLPEKKWIRVELEAKGDYAKSLGKRILSDGYSIALGELGRAIECDAQWWALMFDGDTSGKVNVDRTPGNRVKWQNTTLLSMVETAARENEFFLRKLRELLKSFDNSELPF